MSGPEETRPSYGSDVGKKATGAAVDTDAAGGTAGGTIHEEVMMEAVVLLAALAVVVVALVHPALEHTAGLSRAPFGADLEGERAADYRHHIARTRRSVVDDA